MVAQREEAVIFAALQKSIQHYMHLYSGLSEDKSTVVKATCNAYVTNHNMSQRQRRGTKQLLIVGHDQTINNQ